MTQSELNQRVEAPARSVGGSGLSKRDLLYAAATLNIGGRSQMTMGELSESVTKALQDGVDDRIRAEIQPVARAILGALPGESEQRATC